MAPTPKIGEPASCPCFWRASEFLLLNILPRQTRAWGLESTCWSQKSIAFGLVGIETRKKKSRKVEILDSFSQCYILSVVYLTCITSAKRKDGETRLENKMCSMCPNITQQRNPFKLKKKIITFDFITWFLFLTRIKENGTLQIRVLK